MRNLILKILLIGFAVFACVVVMLGVAGIIPQAMLTTFILGVVVTACFVFGVGLMLRLPFLTLRASLLSLAAIVAVMLGLMWLLPNLIAFKNVEPFHSNILVPTVLILLVLLLISTVIHRR